jgi:hypothetical protein
MQQKLGARDSPTDTTKHRTAELMAHTNLVINRRNNLLKAAKKAGDKGLCKALSAAIPITKKAKRTNKDELAIIMVTIYVVLYELLQVEKFILDRSLSSDLEVFLNILERTMHQCKGDILRESESGSGLGKSVKLSELKMRRGYLQGGGKKLLSTDGGASDPVLLCPKCTFKLFDKEPDYEANKKYNAAQNKSWIELRKHIADFRGGRRLDPPLDANDKVITKTPSNPSYKPTLLRCHIISNYESMHKGGSKCAFGCMIDKKQYPAGQCPACLSDCCFVWDRNIYWPILRMRGNGR